MRDPYPKEIEKIDWLYLNPSGLLEYKGSERSKICPYPAATEQDG